MKDGDEYRVETQHGASKLLGVKAKVDGEVSVAFVKGDVMIGYSTLREFNQQVREGPFREFRTTAKSLN